MENTKKPKLPKIEIRSFIEAIENLVNMAPTGLRSTSVFSTSKYLFMVIGTCFNLKRRKGRKSIKIGDNKERSGEKIVAMD